MPDIAIPPSNGWKATDRLYVSARPIVVDLRGKAVPNSLENRFVAGDPEAIRTLYRRYGRPLYGAAYAIVADHGLAEETVQQTFVKAWRAAHRFDPSRDIAPWLFTIAKRTAIDIYRRERRHPVEDLADHDLGVESGGIETSYAVFQVRQALERLPADEREVLTLTHFAGLSHREASDYLDIPMGTVKSRAHRAYRRLETELEHMKEVST